MKKYSKLVVSMVMVVFMLTIVSISIAADKTYGEVTVEKVVSVYDGDTFKVDIKGWPDIIGKSIGIRIYGIDTPEIRGTRGVVKDLAMLAKAFTDSELVLASKVELRNIRRGKYFRIIADVYVDGKDLAKLLLDNGFAKPYYGGKRPKW